MAVFNHYGWDTYNVFYSELQWHGPDLRLPVEWRASLQFTDQHSVGDELAGDCDTQNYEVKIAAQYKLVLVTLAGRLSVQTDFSHLLEGLSAVASVGAGETGHGLDQRDQEELDITLDYKTPCLDGLWLRVRGGWRDRDGNRTEDYRAILNYERTF